MIDLSYLTEEEQEMILAVLKRDAELKKLEEQRIRQLCKSEKDKRRLKYLTGEWFYETKYHRHREKIHSSDIIRASMRQRKPVTILELSQRWAERPSFVNSQKKDVFIPPELSGLIEEPPTPSRYESFEHQMPEGQQEIQRLKIKPRMNPFNIMHSQRDTDRIINGVKEAGQTPAEDCHELYARPQTSQVSNFHSSAEVKGKANTLCTESQTHTVTEEEGRSISKVLEWFGRGSQDAKQSKLKELPAQSEKNKEEPEDHGTSDVKSEELASPVVQTLAATKPSPKPRRGFFALFSRAEKKDKSPAFLASDKEIISEDKNKILTLECETPFTMRPEAGVSISLQDCVSAVSKTTEIIQVTSKTEVMQHGNATARPVCEDLLKKEMFDQGEISPGRLANPKSFWEMGNRGPKRLSIKTGAEIQEIETSLLNENDEILDRRIPDSGISPSKLNATEYPVEVESTMHEYSSVSRYVVDMSAISLNEDEKPSNLDSSKVSEGSSNELQTHMVKSDVRLVSPSSPPRNNALQNELQEEPLSESLSRDISGLNKEISTLKMSLSQQDNKGSIDDLKSFWEKEKSGLQVIVGLQTCTPDIKDSFTPLSPKHSSIGSTSPDLTSSLDKMSLSLNKEVGLILQNEKMEKSEGPARVPIQDHHDIRGDSEEASPVRSALEHASARPLSVSKSLEDLASTPTLSAVAPNTKTYFLDPTQVKMMSLSVPAFMHQQKDWRNSDCASERSYDTLRTCNTPSNFSMCSEVASMSSVTGSVMSIYSSEFGNVVVKGRIQFAIHYLQNLGEFHIFVVQCKDLAVADPKRNRSDPYVKCYLLPDKAKYGKRKTCVRKKTLDPTYNEILRFKIPMETLKTQKLNLSVWHNDTFGHNSFLGEVEIDLVEWDFNNTQMNEYQLQGRVQVPSSPKHSADGEAIRAEIRVALRFLLQTSHSHKNKANGEVQIWVKECKNLPVSRGVAIDPFVKCAVLPDNSRKSRQKTRVLKRVSNPVFNHTMVYDGFRPEDLKEACVELTVWDHDRLNNHFIGGARLGLGTGKSYGADVEWMDSNSAEAALWDRMMQSQNEWVEDILPLRMLVMARMSR
ncbi:synaptotagmin-like protein 2 isoform X2 [Myxocyprinus asiaticus]|uniref:synaptotagmin-like protein 2 isoform X2 n=1 Tax=Myxocyprinus asiaticus TaxID=70543 RepID=UPI0022222CFB|nr:synaptotagmin-like protein 2 isoform X2 [Myxocyprinus asiaticus]